MSTLATLLVKLGLDKADYDKGLKEAEQMAATFGQKSVAGLSAVGGAAVIGGFAAAGAAAVGLGVFLGKSVEEAMEAQDVQAQLAAVLESTGGVAGVTAEMANGLADSLSGVTRFGDEAILSGENLLLTFTNIGSDIFPEATETMLDMSQALGTDLQGSATMLGKALQDPILGITALRRVGVNFTDEQMEMVKAMVEAGDAAGAQAMILEELQTEFGGSARAAGETFGGQLDILKTKFGNIQETIGAALLPALTELADKFSTWLSDPAVQAGIQNLTVGIANFAQQVMEKIPLVIEWFGNVVTFLQEHHGIIIGILVALGVAISVFVYTTVIPAAVAMITALAPIVIPIMAIIGVVWLLVEAWENNWFGIRDTLTMVWESYLRPIFETLRAWLQEKLGAALQALAGFWTNTLQPAISAVWNFLQSKVFPIFETLNNWLGSVLKLALQGLAWYWDNVLYPAIEVVWEFIQDEVIPIVEILWELFKKGVDFYIKNLKIAWESWLYPALQKVWQFIQDYVFPIFEKIWDFIQNDLGPVISWLANTVLGGLKKAFDGIVTAISGVINWIVNLINKLKEIKLPEWMQFHSPSPWEMALRGVGDAMQELARQDLPELEASLRLNPVMGPSAYAQGGMNIGGDRFVINNFGAGSAAVTRAWVQSRQRQRLNRTMGG